MVYVPLYLIAYSFCCPIRLCFWGVQTSPSSLTSLGPSSCPHQHCSLTAQCHSAPCIELLLLNPSTHGTSRSYLLLIWLLLHTQPCPLGTSHLSQRKRLPRKAHHHLTLLVAANLMNRNTFDLNHTIIIKKDTHYRKVAQRGNCCGFRAKTREVHREEEKVLKHTPQEAACITAGQKAMEAHLHISLSEPSHAPGISISRTQHLLAVHIHLSWSLVLLTPDFWMWTQMLFSPIFFPFMTFFCCYLDLWSFVWLHCFALWQFMSFWSCHKWLP